MAITTEAGLQTAIQDGKRVRFVKSQTSALTGAFFTTWRNGGFPPTGPTPTTTGTALSRTSQGALGIPPASGTSYVAEWEATANQPCVVILADRLVEFAGLVANVTTTQTVSALSLPSRASSATDVELWLEFFSAGGSTASPTVTASYTNQSGTASRTATLVGGLPASNGTLNHRTHQLSLQAGDTGVQSVQSVTLGTSTGTAGNMGLVLRRSLVTGVVSGVGAGFYQTWAETDLQICGDDAALEILHMCANGTAPFITGAVRLAQG